MEFVCCIFKLEAIDHTCLLCYFDINKYYTYDRQICRRVPPFKSEYLFLWGAYQGFSGNWALVLQHIDLTVISEERVLNAILLWCLRAEDLHGWELVEEKILNSSPELLFGDRLQSLNKFLPLVRFSLLPHALLKKVGIIYMKIFKLFLFKMPALKD